jgi:hypothetical protein
MGGVVIFILLACFLSDSCYPDLRQRTNLGQRSSWEFPQGAMPERDDWIQTNLALAMQQYQRLKSPYDFKGASTPIEHFCTEA